MEIELKVHEFASVFKNENTNQCLLRSRKVFLENDVLCLFNSQKTLSEPTYLTIQTAKNQHILLNPSFLQYINHSCNPNVFFNIETSQLICLKPIAIAEEITFFYPSTEWEMIQPFDCFCQSENCLHAIKGAKFISSAILQKYRTSNFILSKSFSIN